jgi:DNA-binding CsgD family transcriptional regulator
VNEVLERTERLTAREMQIVLLASRGRQNKAIAVELDIRPSTVAAHLRRVDLKLEIGGRADLIRLFSTPKTIVGVEENLAGSSPSMN